MKNKMNITLTIGVVITLIIIGILSGTLSGLVGVGGGIIIVPCLVFFLAFPQKMAQGTSLAVLTLPVVVLHGVRRAVHIAPLAKNSSAFLKGANERLQWYSRPLDKVINMWRERWLLPRASRDDSYRTFDKESWCKITGT